MVRNDGLAERDRLVIVLRVNHLPLDRVLHGLLELILVEVLQVVLHVVIKCLLSKIYEF